jgi:hypothetical protein
MPALRTVCAAAALACAAVVAGQAPPVWPDAYSVSFTETQKINGTVPVSTNKGAWYYDFTGKQARFDHGVGQFNNFCQGPALDNSRFVPPIKNASGNW